MAPPIPGPPPADIFPQLPGYTAIVSTEPVLIEPTLPTAEPSANGTKTKIPPLPRLTEQQARVALLEEYTLETFTETRHVSWKVEPYYGQALSSMSGGSPPQPWDMHVAPPMDFQNTKTAIEIPYSGTLKPCYYCNSFGQVRCYQCQGRGKLRCSQCRGQGFSMKKDKTGTHFRETCTRCFGSGRRRCTVCFGHGQIGCAVCAARGELKLSLLLSITWSNHRGEHVVEPMNGPKGDIAACQGSLLFTDSANLLAPIGNFPEDQVNTGSHGLVSRHSKQWPQERILRQRHSLELIPVHEVNYTYRDEMKRFWVYGLDHRLQCHVNQKHVLCGTRVHCAYGPSTGNGQGMSTVLARCASYVCL
ncbi:uncharacterized protein MONBRDRAFT_31030 [Monosiga brevicollis MX1]|uniref:Protein SSUH2 homolog n=1 Tax=Monosiga brevicollis TaxID=81824 RepID=A9UQU0_MONBE|nr:uncharacterized protein MONBRDRAFT_31030 [Monosiga brevicollis MX1]EDQ92657.1 predicted protein [Monosiga brevicollis MX1]|eukprot:XP_001742419.1 hypothetical protein [Monosiga brevicollis MX1]